MTYQFLKENHLIHQKLLPEDFEAFLSEITNFPYIIKIPDMVLGSIGIYLVEDYYSNIKRRFKNQ